MTISYFSFFVLFVRKAEFCRRIEMCGDIYEVFADNNYWRESNGIVFAEFKWECGCVNAFKYLFDA